MSSTYLVLYVIGQIVFTLGPYPDGADDVCKTSAIEFQEKVRENWTLFQEVVKAPLKPIDLIVKCVQADERPKIDGDEIPFFDR